jgi:dUTP pyrophosphatase
MIKINIKKLNENAILPSYARLGDAGADLCSIIDATLNPGDRLAVPTGLSVAIPEGFVGLVHPRSGLALNHGVTVLNAPGTIDAGYRGEIKVLLVNNDKWKTHTIQKGNKIAQLVIQKVEQAEFFEVEELDETDRGIGGFGSTGK